MILRLRKNMFKGSATTLSILVLTTILLTACTTATKRPDAENQIPQPQQVIIVDAMTEEERFGELERIRNEPLPEFRLGRGDTLKVSVYDESDLSTDSIPVRPDGKISFPLIGEITAEGKTSSEIEKEITERISKFLVDPKVSVLVRGFRSQRYTIIGEVAKPGTFSLDTSVTLTQALANSGGLSQRQFHGTSIDLADLGRAFISRNGKILPVDFAALFRNGDLRYDVDLRSGDYIYIPSGLDEEVFVLGEVNSPDMFAYRKGMSLSKALVIADGYTSNANLKQVHVVRGSLTDPELYIVNLKDIYNGEVTDITLQPGDIVYLPKTGLASWSQIVNQILPSMALARTGNVFTD
jgi:polysaccharide biosynthesis/export protein